MAGRRRMARIISGDDTTIVVDAAEPVANAYGNGLLRWLGGANGGCESAIAMSAGATLTLTAPPPFAADAGTMIELIEGRSEEHTSGTPVTNGHFVSRLLL